MKTPFGILKILIQSGRILLMPTIISRSSWVELKIPFGFCYKESMTSDCHMPFLSFVTKRALMPSATRTCSSSSRLWASCSSFSSLRCFISVSMSYLCLIIAEVSSETPCWERTSTLGRISSFNSSCYSPLLSWLFSSIYSFSSAAHLGIGWVEAFDCADINTLIWLLFWVGASDNRY